MHISEHLASRYLSTGAVVYPRLLKSRLADLDVPAYFLSSIAELPSEIERQLRDFTSYQFPCIRLMHRD